MTAGIAALLAAGCVAGAVVCLRARRHRRRPWLLAGAVGLLAGALLLLAYLAATLLLVGAV